MIHLRGHAANLRADTRDASAAQGHHPTQDETPFSSWVTRRFESLNDPFAKSRGKPSGWDPFSEKASIRRRLRAERQLMNGDADQRSLLFRAGL